MPGHKQAVKACKILLNEGFYKDGGINYFGSLEHSETCVTGMILSILSYFNFEDERLEELATAFTKTANERWGMELSIFRGCHTQLISYNNKCA